MKLPGVDWVEVSLAKASADIDLKAENRVTLPQLRDVLKKSGYPTRDARIEARGRIVRVSGKLVFDLLNGTTLPIVADAKGALPAETPQPVEIVGVSRADGKAGEKLTVTTVR
jgi:hypothetical protein